MFPRRDREQRRESRAHLPVEFARYNVRSLARLFIQINFRGGEREGAYRRGFVLRGVIAATEIDEYFSAYTGAPGYECSRVLAPARLTA